MQNVSRQSCKTVSWESQQPLCATAIEMLIAEVFQARHIMFMVRHRKEASFRSFNRGCFNGLEKTEHCVLQCLILWMVKKRAILEI